MLAALDRGRIYMAASSVGIARASLEAAIRYATEQKIVGTVIGQHQAIKLKLANMAIRVRAAPAAAHAAARRIDRDGQGRQQRSHGQGVRIGDQQCGDVLFLFLFLFFFFFFFEQFLVLLSSNQHQGVVARGADSGRRCRSSRGDLPGHPCPDRGRAGRTRGDE